MDRFIRFTIPKPIIPLVTKKTINIPTKPFKSISINPLIDDYYSRLLDWHSSSIVYASENTIYNYNTKTEQTVSLQTFHHFCLNSVKIFNNESFVVGVSPGYLQIQDFNSTSYNKFHIHKSRIGAIETFENNLFTGSRDRTIKSVDMRNGKECFSIKVHLQEVCGLKINSSGKLIASGGNDNKLYVHDSRRTDIPLFKAHKHKAAVKALTWSPCRSSVLASGGGTADKSLKIWDMSQIGNGKVFVKGLDYQSQVCNLYWTKKNEIISTHGYSRNDIRIIRAGSMDLKNVFTGSGNRTIHFAVDDEEENFVCGGSDGKLHFWKIHATKKNFMR